MRTISGSLSRMVSKPSRSPRRRRAGACVCPAAGRNRCRRSSRARSGCRARRTFSASRWGRTYELVIQTSGRRFANSFISCASRECPALGATHARACRTSIRQSPPDHRVAPVCASASVASCIGRPLASVTCAAEGLLRTRSFGRVL